MAIAGVRSRSRRPSGRPSPRFPQGPMRPQPVVLKQTQDHQHIPGLHRLRKDAGPACQRVQPVSHDAVPSFLMHWIETIHRLSQNRTHPHAHNLAPTTALDGLNPPHPRRGHEGRTLPLSRGAPFYFIPHNNGFVKCSRVLTRAFQFFMAVGR